MKSTLDKIALSIRSLAIDAIEKAKSGHPGMVLGSAELVSALYGVLLKHNPKAPEWLDRDRFVFLQDMVQCFYILFCILQDMIFL